MSTMSRRTMITRGLAAAAGLSGLAAAERIADRYGLVPPDRGGLFGPGETLTYAAQRVLTRHSLAREFSRSQISNPPFANETVPPTAEFARLQANGFKDWRLAIDGLVAQPMALSLDDIKRFPSHRQITEIACEEGWSYVAEWIGTTLGDVLHAAGVMPQARYVVYFSIEASWWESVDMADALHPQTLLAYAMNGAPLTPEHGAPLRLVMPHKYGIKNIKLITHIAYAANRPDDYWAERGYDYYAGL